MLLEVGRILHRGDKARLHCLDERITLSQATTESGLDHQAVRGRPLTEPVCCPSLAAHSACQPGAEGRLQTQPRPDAAHQFCREGCRGCAGRV